MKPQKTRISSYALIIQDRRILLCRISPEIPRAAGRWTLPGGGIDFGEAPEYAAVREVREETGLDVRIKNVATVDSEFFTSDESDMHMVRIIYHAVLTGGTLRHETEGSTDRAQWFTREEAERQPLVEVARLGVRLAFATERLETP